MVTIQCSCCGKDIDIGVRYCSGACKVRAHRAKGSTIPIKAHKIIKTVQDAHKAAKSVHKAIQEPCRHGLLYCATCM